MVECYYTSIWLSLLNFFLIILTVGILGLIELFSQNLYLKIQYRKVLINKATHFLITSKLGTNLIVRRVNFDNDYFGFIYKDLKYSYNDQDNNF